MSENTGSASGAAPLLDVRDLVAGFKVGGSLVKAVDGVSLRLYPGRTLGLVGESGSGKSVTSLAIMGLLPMPPAEVTGAQMRYGEVDLLELDAEERRRYRGRELAMIFQEPMTSLNPVYTVGEQIIEALRAHFPISHAEARKRAIAVLDLVRIPSAATRVDSFPHEMSGGMRQRAMIAMALACEPKLLIADEPTTALDVTIQAQILELLGDMQKRTGTAILLITHDLGVIAEVADDVAVMYAGKIVETASVQNLFADPQHPYTIGLLGSVPRLEEDRARLATIEGTVPNPASLPVGCRFHPRCPFAIDKCRAEQPPLMEISPGHDVACWRAPIETIPELRAQA
ncbi:MAG: transporter ATP-binding protein [Alphaproteobacteria bacterium]|nr:transporter ATP-binding protein [Alphaproteobacteria bacterium]